MMYLKYPANNLTYIYSQSTPYAGALDAWIEGKVEEYRDPIEVVPSYGFAYQNLSKVVLPFCSTIGEGAFEYCQTLESVYLLSTSVCTISNSNIFFGTPIADSTYLGYYGSIYVPGSLVETYKAANNWSYFADRIVACGDSQ